MADRSHGHGRGHHAPNRSHSSARRLTDELSSFAGEQAAEAARVLRDRGRELLTDRKTRAAEELSHVGAAVHRAADKLHDQKSDVIAQYVDSAAQRIDTAARYLQEHDLADLGQQIGALARRRPALVFGGLFLAGVVAARFVRAAQPRESPRSRRRLRSIQ